MAVAGVGVFAAYTDATETPTTTFVVAIEPLRAGERIEAAHVRQERGTLPAALRDQSFAEVAEVIGRAALRPMGSGDLLQPSMITDDIGAGHEVAVMLPRSQLAVGGLKQGDRVDIFVTRDDRTESVVRGVPVVQLDAGGDGSLTSERELTLVVEVSDGASVAALVHAIRTGDVTVVRSTFSEVATEVTLGFGAGPDDASSAPGDGDAP